MVLCSSQGDLAFCQINLRLRSPDLPTHSFRCIFLLKEFWSRFVSGLYLLQKPIDPASTFLDDEPPEVDYCVIFQFLTLPNGVYSAGVQFFLNFFLLTFVGLVFSMGTLAIGRFLYPYLEKAFLAMVLCLVRFFSKCKEFRKKSKWVGGGRPGSAPLSGDGASLADRAEILRRLAASQSRRAPDNSDPNSKF